MGGGSRAILRYGLAGELLFRAGFEHGEKGFLRNVDGADRFHPLFAFLLLCPEFALAGDVAAVAFGGHVFAHGGIGFAGDDAAADSGLDGDLEHVAVDFGAQFFHDRTAAAVGIALVADDR